jgi:hypothetical protein
MFERNSYTYQIYNKEEASRIIGNQDLNIGVKRYNAAEHINELEKIKKEINENQTCVKTLKKREEAFSIIAKTTGMEKSKLETDLLKF